MYFDNDDHSDTPVRRSLKELCEKSDIDEEDDVRLALSFWIHKGVLKSFSSKVKSDSDSGVDAAGLHNVEEADTNIDDEQHEVCYELIEQQAANAAADVLLQGKTAAGGNKGAMIEFAGGSSAAGFGDMDVVSKYSIDFVCYRYYWVLLYLCFSYNI